MSLKFNCHLPSLKRWVSHGSVLMTEQCYYIQSEILKRRWSLALLTPPLSTSSSLHMLISACSNMQHGLVGHRPYLYLGLLGLQNRGSGSLSSLYMAADAVTVACLPHSTKVTASATHDYCPVA